MYAIEFLEVQSRLFAVTRELAVCSLKCTSISEGAGGGP